MAKVQIPVPNNFAFSTEIDVMIQHINRANHLANEHLIAMLNEARTRYNNEISKSYQGVDLSQFINADLAVIYKSEAHHGDRLTIEVTPGDFNRYGCDFLYRVSKTESGQLVAIAKTAMLHFCYETQALKPVPDDFKDIC